MQIINYEMNFIKTNYTRIIDYTASYILLQIFAFVILSFGFFFRLLLRAKFCFVLGGADKPKVWLAEYTDTPILQFITFKKV